MTDDELIEAALRTAGQFRTSDDCVAGGVAAALLTRGGRLYTGICVDLSCSLGACAEHAAITEMLKSRESEIAAIVAVCDGRIVPPCGRCRELIRLVNRANVDTRVLVARGRAMSLSDLLPLDWSGVPG